MLVEDRADPAPAARIGPARPVSRHPYDLWVVATLVVIGAALRFATIGSQSFWFDEATTVHEMHLSFGGLLHAVRAGESTPPLYFVLAWLWTKIWGTGEVGLRSLSAIAGIALIPIAYLCGRELVSRWAGIVAAALTAVSPFMIWYSQEARAYMLLAALSGLSFLYFARASREPSARNVAWWTAWSTLAILTHFFAAFLVAPEAVWLLISARNRVVLLGSATIAAVQLALLPLLVGDISHPLLGWIKQFPLSVRIEQVPVDFGLSTLYQSSVVNDGLLGAGVLAVLLVILLAIGSGPGERRGAAIAAAVSAVVILAPLVFAELGRDYYVVRNLIPAWAPLAVLVGAACAAPRAQPAGAVLATVLLAGFVYAGIFIDDNPQYQRPNWRAVANALGGSSRTRAIVAYDGSFAQPLVLYLHGVPWNPPPQKPVDVGEVDVVGDAWQAPSRPLPQGTRLLSSHAVDGFEVDRFAVTPAWRLTPAAVGSRASDLLGPAPPAAAVFVQRSSGGR